MFGFHYNKLDDDDLSDHRPPNHLHFNPSVKPRSKLGRRKTVHSKDGQSRETGSCTNLESNHNQNPPYSTKNWLREDSGFSAGFESTPSTSGKTNSTYPSNLKSDGICRGLYTTTFKIGQENTPFSKFALPTTPVFRSVNNDPLKEIVPNLMKTGVPSFTAPSSNAQPILSRVTEPSAPFNVQKQLNSSFCCDESNPSINTSDPQQTSPEDKPNITNTSDRTNDSSFITAHDINRSTNRTLYDPDFLKTPGKNLAEIRIVESPFDPLKEFVESDDSGVGKLCDEKSISPPIRPVQIETHRDGNDNRLNPLKTQFSLQENQKAIEDSFKLPSIPSQIPSLNQRENALFNCVNSGISNAWRSDENGVISIDNENATYPQNLRCSSSDLAQHNRSCSNLANSNVQMHTLSDISNSHIQLTNKKKEVAESDCETHLKASDVENNSPSEQIYTSCSVDVKTSDQVTLSEVDIGSSEKDYFTSVDWTAVPNLKSPTTKVARNELVIISEDKSHTMPTKRTETATGGEDDVKTVIFNNDKQVPSQSIQPSQSANAFVATCAVSQKSNGLSGSVIPGLIKPQPQNVITIKGVPYTVLSLLGKGGSSQVYQALGPQSSKLMAIKCVNLSQVEDAMAADYLNEIKLLSQLQGCPSVIKMFDHEYNSQTKVLFVVLEKGDIDFSKLVKNITETANISMPMIIYYWTEMLNAVHEIHKRRIIHSDLKPANFLLVEGRLKLIDFGIASSLQGDTTSIMKDVPAGTYNYMSPEAIRSQKITRKSDVWSMGCILYNLLYRRTPYSHVTNRWPKLMAIADPNLKVEFPKLSFHVPPSLRLALRWCLIKDPKSRPTVEELIQLSELSLDGNSALGREMDAMMCQYFRRVIPNLREIGLEDNM